MGKLLLILLLTLSSPIKAELVTVETKQEVSHLFATLENSDCQFNRNGDWYSSKEAASHLGKKYQYLLDRRLVNSTESFIEKAATKSSISGEPYLVKCNGKSLLESAAWFHSELDKYRSNRH